MNKNINNSQKKAIETIDGPVLILAGPGSGKTFTIVERVVHMVADLGIDPSSILISTFTNKASKELLDRLSLKFAELKISKDVNDMLLGNFHSICLEILDQYIDFSDLKKGYQIIDEVQKKYLISKYLAEFRKIPGYYDIIKSYDISNIDKITKLVFEEGILLGDLENYGLGNSVNNKGEGFENRKSGSYVSQEHVGRGNYPQYNNKYRTIISIAKLYEKMLIDLNLLDFSSVLYFTYKLIMENEEVRQELRARIKYIMVDEYQDTNRVQEKILFALLNEGENICVVGDDDQGLYRFRGATVKNILNFGSEFKCQTTLVNLDINYRSTSQIINFYTNFMNDLNSIPDIDKYRFRKDLKSVDITSYDSVFKLSCIDFDDYRERIVNKIIELKDRGAIKHFNEVCILVSSVNHSEVMKLATALKKIGIGVYTPKTSKLITRPEIMDLIGALFAIFKDQILSRKIPIDKKTFEFLDLAYSKFLRSMAKYPDTEKFIASMSSYTTSQNFSVALIDIIYRLFRYEPFRGHLSNTEEDKARKNISRFLELVEAFSYSEFLYYINERNIESFLYKFFANYIGFIKDENIGEFEEDTFIPDENSLSLLTIHASKGMEYPVVFMASLWDRPYKTYSFEFDKLLDDFAAFFGRKDFEPSRYQASLDFYRKYFTGFSRAENLLILAGVDGYNNSQIGPELRSSFASLRELDTIDYDRVKKSSPKINKTKEIYSYTQDIVQYRNCPRAYYFFRKLKYPMPKSKGATYGILVHESLEFINKSIIAKEKINRDELTTKLRDLAVNEYKKGAVFINGQLLEKIEKELDKYLEFTKKIDQIKASEMAISVAKEDFLLTGNVDLVLNIGGKLTILDFKTGSNANEEGNLMQEENTDLPKKADPVGKAGSMNDFDSENGFGSANKPNPMNISDLLNQYINQLKLYSYLYSETKSEEIEQIALYFTSLSNSQSYLSLDINAEGRETNMTQISDTIAQIERDKTYKKTKDKSKCSSCPLRFYCDRI